MKGKMKCEDEKLFLYLCIYTRMVLLCTAKAPGHNTLQLPITHNRTTRVALIVPEQYTCIHTVCECFEKVLRKIIMLRTVRKLTWHESLPPSKYPAQNIASVIMPG